MLVLFSWQNKNHSIVTCKRPRDILQRCPGIGKICVILDKLRLTFLHILQAQFTTNKKMYASKMWMNILADIHVWLYHESNNLLMNVMQSCSNNDKFYIRPSQWGTASLLVSSLSRGRRLTWFDSLLTRNVVLWFQQVHYLKYHR